MLVNWFNTLLDTKEETLSMDAATNWVTKLKYNVLVGNTTKMVPADTYNSLKIKRTADIISL